MEVSVQSSSPSEPSRERTSSVSGFIDAFLPAGMDLRQSLSASVRSRGTSTESETASKLESLRDDLIGNTSLYTKAELGCISHPLASLIWVPDDEHGASMGFDGSSDDDGGEGALCRLPISLLAPPEDEAIAGYAAADAAGVSPEASSAVLHLVRKAVCVEHPLADELAALRVEPRRGALAQAHASSQAPSVRQLTAAAPSSLYESPSISPFQLALAAKAARSRGSASSRQSSRHRAPTSTTTGDDGARHGARGGIELDTERPAPSVERVPLSARSTWRSRWRRVISSRTTGKLVPRREEGAVAGAAAATMGKLVPGVAERRAELAFRVDQARAHYQHALHERDEELNALMLQQTTAPLQASAQMRQHRRSGLAHLVRRGRVAWQTAYAWRALRFARLCAERAALASAAEELAGYSERLWGGREGSQHAVFDAADVARASASDAVLYAPAKLLERQPEVTALARCEMPLQQLRDEAQRQYDTHLKSSLLTSKDERRRLLVALLKGGCHATPWYYEPEDSERCGEAARLLLWSGSSERAIVQRWLIAVEHEASAAYVAAGRPSHSATAADAGAAGGVADATAKEDEAAHERHVERLRALRLRTQARRELVLPMLTELAQRLQQASGLPSPFLPVAEHLMGRVLLPMAEPCLLRCALAEYQREDELLVRQQRRLRQRSPEQLQVGRYVEAHPTTGLPVLTPLAAALEALSALSYAQASVDYAMLVAAAVKAVEVHCAASAEDVVSADVLLPVMVLVVIHAELPHAYAVLKHAYNYLEPQAARSELGYCLVTYEAALEHVLNTDE